MICRLDDGQLVIVRQAVARGRRRPRRAPVRLVADAEVLHVFDADTERRIEPA